MRKLSLSVAIFFATMWQLSADPILVDSFPKGFSWVVYVSVDTLNYQKFVSYIKNVGSVTYGETMYRLDTSGYIQGSKGKTIFTINPDWTLEVGRVDSPSLFGISKLKEGKYGNTYWKEIVWAKKQQSEEADMASLDALFTTRDFLFWRVFSKNQE